MTSDKYQRNQEHIRNQSSRPYRPGPPTSPHASPQNSSPAPSQLPQDSKPAKTGFTLVLNNSWVVNIICGLLLMLIAWLATNFYQEYHLLPAVKTSIQKAETLEKRIVELSKDIKELKENYLQKDQEGMPVMVGINSEMAEGTVSIYKNNKTGLKFRTWLQLTNPLNQLKPTLTMVVVGVSDKTGDTYADLFISPKAAEIFGVDLSKGVFPMNMKILEDASEKKGE